MYDARIPYKYEGDEDKDYANTAVFISHAHLDHTRMLNYLDPSIPLYTLKETKNDCKFAQPQWCILTTIAV